MAQLNLKVVRCEEYNDTLYIVIFMASNNPEALIYKMQKFFDYLALLEVLAGDTGHTDVTLLHEHVVQSLARAHKTVHFHLLHTAVGAHT